MRQHIGAEVGEPQLSKQAIGVAAFTKSENRQRYSSMLDYWGDEATPNSLRNYRCAWRWNDSRQRISAGKMGTGEIERLVDDQKRCRWFACRLT